MAALIMFRAWANKGIQNKAMNGFNFLLSLVSLAAV